MLGEVLGDERYKLVEGDKIFAGDVVGHQHFLYFLFGGLVPEPLHGLLPFLDGGEATSREMVPLPSVSN